MRSQHARPAPAISLWSRVFAQLRDPLIVVLLAAVALTVATADYADAIIIGVVVLFNTTVGVVQEVRADNAVAALSAMTAPTARVMRDGTEQELASAGCRTGRRPDAGGGRHRCRPTPPSCRPPHSWSTSRP